MCLLCPVDRTPANLVSQWTIAHLVRYVPVVFHGDCPEQSYISLSYFNAYCWDTDSGKYQISSINVTAEQYRPLTFYVQFFDITSPWNIHWEFCQSFAPQVPPFVVDRQGMAYQG